DLAAANSGSPQQPGTTISVLLGNRDGTFRAALTFAAGSGPYSVAVGDFNGDGRPDLAVANYGSLQQPGTTSSVLLGNGDGTFRAARTNTVDTNPSSVAVGDFNGDGKPDLAVANSANNTWPSSGQLPGNLSVLLGNGDGTFRAAQTFTTGTTPEYLAVGDFNGDGKADLAVANYRSHN